MADIELIPSEWSWDKDYALTQMVRSGDYLWLSGQIAYDENGNIVGPGDLEAQARQVFTNMRQLLQVAGHDLTSVVRLTNYFAVPSMDMALTRRYWAVKQEFFGGHQPASTGMRVAGLMTPDILLEVDAIAYAPQQ